MAFVIVKANYRSRVDYDVFNSICGTEYTTDVELNETDLSLLKEKAKEKFGIDIIGFGDGEFMSRIYFTTGEAQ